MFILCIDETGGSKKGKTMDYAAHQYICHVGKLENGVVSNNAYGILPRGCALERGAGRQLVWGEQ